MNDSFPLILDLTLSSSVDFSIVFTCLEDFSQSSDREQELYYIAESTEMKAEVKAMKYKQAIALCQTLFSSAQRFMIFKEVATEEKNIKS